MIRNIRIIWECRIRLFSYMHLSHSLSVYIYTRHSAPKTAKNWFGHERERNPEELWKLAKMSKNVSQRLPKRLQVWVNRATKTFQEASTKYAGEKGTQKPPRLGISHTVYKKALESTLQLYVDTHIFQMVFIHCSSFWQQDHGPGPKEAARAMTRARPIAAVEPGPASQAEKCENEIKLLWNKYEDDVIQHFHTSFIFYFICCSYWHRNAGAQDPDRGPHLHMIFTLLVILFSYNFQMSVQSWYRSISILQFLQPDVWQHSCHTLPSSPLSAIVQNLTQLPKEFGHSRASKSSDYPITTQYIDNISVPQYVNHICLIHILLKLPTTFQKLADCRFWKLLTAPDASIRNRTDLLITRYSPWLRSS